MALTVTRKKYVLGILVLTFLVEGFGAAVFFYCCPQHYFDGYPLIPFFFLIFEYLFSGIFDTVRSRYPKQLMNLYMGKKVLKMLLSGIIILSYGLLVRHEAVAFALTFVVNYLIFLAYESLFLMNYELAKKKQKKERRSQNEMCA